MALEVDAIYEDGLFVPLSPVPLQNGEKVKLDVKTQYDELRVILAGLIVEDEDDEILDEEETLPPFAPIEVDWKGGLTASEMIIEERGEL